MSRIVVNMMDSRAPTDDEIGYMAAEDIRERYSDLSERKIVRQYLADTADAAAKAAFDAYNVFIEGIRAEAAAARAQAAVLRVAIDYEHAVPRMAHYRLADGRPEQTLQVPTGEQVLDEITGMMVDVMVTQIIPAIDPLPATVQVMDEAGDPVDIPNPAIVEDDAQRAAAQAVIDGASAEVVALVAARA